MARPRAYFAHWSRAGPNGGPTSIRPVDSTKRVGSASCAIAVSFQFAVGGVSNFLVNTSIGRAVMVTARTSQVGSERKNRTLGVSRLATVDGSMLYDSRCSVYAVDQAPWFCARCGSCCLLRGVCAKPGGLTNKALRRRFRIGPQQRSPR